MSQLELVAQPLDAGGAEGMALARAFARERVFERCWLHGALEVDALRKRSRFQEVLCQGRLVGLGALIEGALPYRLFPLAASLPGAARALLERVERPFVSPLAERDARELSGAGELVRRELLLARLSRTPLPAPDARIQRLEDPGELRSLHGREIADLQLESGPLFGARDERGALVSVGGVRFVTDRVAALAHVETREDFRRRGLARGIVVELVRALETPARSLLVQIGENDAPARGLYAGLGFRGCQRIWMYAFGKG